MTILVVDRSEIAREALLELLEQSARRAVPAASVRVARRHAGDAVLLLLLDYTTLGEAARLPRLMREFPGAACVVLADGISVTEAVACMRAGACNVLHRPCDPEVLLGAVREAMPASAPGARGPGGFQGMIGDSAPMQRVYRILQRAAPTEATLLIQGETGCGKELAARAAHALSRRSGEEFIAVNCAAIPDTLVEAELFGNEKGAFTGATGSRRGLVEAADRGTLFLDEVGELPLEAQARLLRVLQEGEVRRVGGTRTRAVDVRVLAATHRDLTERVAAGRFREDLYYRLNVLPLRIPALRERPEDIPDLAATLLGRHARALGRPLRGLEPDAVNALRQHAWPGNIRELDNVLHRACILADGESVSAHDLQFDPVPAPDGAPGVQTLATPPRWTLEQYVRQFLLSHQDRMTETEIAQNLGISRKCLWEKRQKLGIPRQRRGDLTQTP